MKLIQKYFLCLLIVFTQLKNYSQNRNIDSLTHLFQNETNDSVKIEYCYKLAYLVIETGNLTKADSILDLLLTEGFTGQDIKRKLYFNHYKGYVSELRGEYSVALNYYFEALKLAEAGNYPKNTASINSNIGVIYYSQNQFDKALKYYFKAVDVVRKNPGIKGLGNFYNNIGNVFFAKHDYIKAIDYYKQSLKIRTDQQDERGIANSLNNIGNVYMQLKDNDKALDCFNKAIEIQEKNEDHFNLAYSFLNKGLIYQEKGDYPLSEKNILKGLTLSKQINFPDALRDSYSALAGLYELKGETGKALNYYKLFISFRDSLKNDQQLKEVNQREMNNELFKKEVLLKAENEKQKLENTEKQKRNKILLYSVLFILLLIVVFSISIYKRYRQAKMQKKIIEEKQKEILDSIRYAKRIQQAMLPSEKFIDLKINKKSSI